MSRFESRTRCAICGNLKAANEIWFSVTEDCRLDRVSVWRWTAMSSRDPQAHHVCGPIHAREIIVHWMTAGCLHYPFATDLRSPRKPLAPVAASSAPAEGGRRLAELSVDRMSILRVLSANPASLNVILEELAMALGAEPTDGEEGTFSELEILAGRF